MRRWTSYFNLTLCLMLLLVLSLTFFACGNPKNSNNDTQNGANEVLTQEIVGETLKPYYHDFLEKSGHPKEFIDQYFSYNYFDDYAKDAYDFFMGLGVSKEEFVNIQKTFKPFWENVVSYYVSDKNYRAEEITKENIQYGLTFFSELVSILDIEKVGNVIDRLYKIENNFNFTETQLKEIFRKENRMDLYNQWYGKDNPFNEFSKNIYHNEHVKNVVKGIVAGAKHILVNNDVEDIQKNMLIMKQLLKVKTVEHIFNIVMDANDALATSSEAVKVINFLGNVLDQYLVGAESIPNYTKSIEVVSNMLLNRLNYTLDVTDISELVHFAANVLKDANVKEIKSIAIDIIRLVMNEQEGVSKEALIGAIIVKAVNIVDYDYNNIPTSAKKFLCDLLGFEGTVTQFDDFVYSCSKRPVDELNWKDFKQFYDNFMALVKIDILNRPDTIDDLIFVKKGANVDQLYQEILKTNSMVKSKSGDYYKFSSYVEKSNLEFDSSKEGYSSVMFKSSDDLVNVKGLKKYYSIPVYFYDETTDLGLSFEAQIGVKSPLILKPEETTEDLKDRIENEMKKLQVVNCKTLLVYNPYGTNYEYDIIGNVNTTPGLHIGIVKLHHPIFEGKEIPFIYYVCSKAPNGGIFKNLTRIEVKGLDNTPYLVGEKEFKGTVNAYYDFDTKLLTNDLPLSKDKYTIEGFDTTTPGVKELTITAYNGVTTKAKITVVTEDMFKVGRDYTVMSFDIYEHEFNQLKDSSGNVVVVDGEVALDIPIDIETIDFIHKVTKGRIYLKNNVFGYALQFDKLKDIKDVGLNYTIICKYYKKVGEMLIYEFSLKTLYKGKQRDIKHIFYTGIKNPNVDKLK